MSNFVVHAVHYLGSRHTDCL